MPARNRNALAGAVALALVALEVWLASQHRVLFGDFRAFYCSGAALLHGQDPYAAAPLYACERSVQPFGLYRALPGVAVPAPFPGYVLLFFAAFAAAPYPVSCALWLVLLLGACAGSGLAIARLARCEIAAAVAVVTAGFAVAVLPLGEISPLAIFGLCAMALALRHGAWTRATLAGALTLVLPHVGVPALAAAFVARREMRVRLLLLAAVFAACDVAAGGAARYFTAVLPAHALSEVGSTTQYGATWMLHALGAPDRAALAGGEAWYAAMLIAGIAAAMLCARRSGDRAYLALMPPAFVVFGGTFIHFSEILAALPAAMLLFSGTRGALRGPLLPCIAALAMPWGAVLGDPATLLVIAAAGAAIVWHLSGREVGAALRGAFACVLVGALIIVAAAHFGPSLPHAVSGTAVDPLLAQSSWDAYVRAHRSSSGIVWWIVKAPTWLALAVLALGGAYAAAKKDLVAPVAIEQAPAVP